MPIKHAALKQIRKDRKRQSRNQAVQSELRTITKRFLALLSNRKFDDAKALLPLLAKHYDHAASLHVIHRNTAARSKSRLTLQLNRRLA